MTPVLLCLGAGYCATAWARERLAAGWIVRGTSTRPEGLAALRAAGVEPFEFGPGRPLAARAWEGVTHLLSSIPPSASGDPGWEALSARGPRGLEWVGYLSSSGVYGDHAGAWVDEESPLRPSNSARATRRQEAEARWRSLQGYPWQVFRLAGIYGPGRGPLERVRAGYARRYDAPEHWFARIHRDDVVGALSAAIAAPRPGRVYNLCDLEPAPSAEVTAEACRLLGRPVPPLEPLELEALPPGLADFYRDRKRLRSVRLGPELGLELRYPSYRSGLAACLGRPGG